jgi:hypothetical protein
LDLVATLVAVAVVVRKLGAVELAVQVVVVTEAVLLVAIMVLPNQVAVLALLALAVMAVMVAVVLLFLNIPILNLL